MIRPRGLLPEPTPPSYRAVLGDLVPGGGPEVTGVPQAFNYFDGLKPDVAFANDSWPDCTVAGQAHAVRVITQVVWGQEVILPDPQVLEVFTGLGGTRTTGLVETDVLDFMCTTGIPLPTGQTEDIFSGYVHLDHTDLQSLRAAAWVFGGVHIGSRLPKEADVLFENGQDFDIPEGQPLTGQWEPDEGHEMLCAGADADGYLRMMTWGRVVRVSPRFAAAYVDAAQVAISRLWLQTTGRTAAGLDFDQLMTTAARLRAA